jgi:hypothetical protein
VGVILRTGIGFALFSGGLTFLTYGIAQAIENGSCGTDEYGNSVGPPCPSGFGPMIVLMVLGTFVAIVGAGIASSRRDSPGLGMVGGTIRFFAALIFAAIAAVVFGIVDLHADDTRPGVEVVVAVVVPVLLFGLPGIARRRPGAGAATTPPVVMAAVDASGVPAAPHGPVTPAQAEEVASRLRQLDQLRESGLLDESEYRRRRKQILGEL